MTNVHKQNENYQPKDSAILCFRSKISANENYQLKVSANDSYFIKKTKNGPKTPQKNVAGTNDIKILGKESFLRPSTYTTETVLEEPTLSQGASIEVKRLKLINEIGKQKPIENLDPNKVPITIEVKEYSKGNIEMKNKPSLHKASKNNEVPIINENTVKDELKNFEKKNKPSKHKKRNHKQKNLKGKPTTKELFINETCINQLGNKKPSINKSGKQRPFTNTLENQELSIKQLENQKPCINQLGSQKPSINQLENQELSINQLGKQNSCINQLGNQKPCINQLENQELSINQLGEKNTCINQLGSQKPCRKQLENQEISINQLGKQNTCINQLGNQIASINYLENKEPCINHIMSQKPFEKNNLGNQKQCANQLENQEPSINEFRNEQTSINHLENQKPFINQLGNQKPYINQLRNQKHSINQLGNQKHSINQLGNQSPTTKHLEDEELPKIEKMRIEDGQTSEVEKDNSLHELIQKPKKGKNKRKKKVKRTETLNISSDIEYTIDKLVEKASSQDKVGEKSNEQLNPESEGLTSSSESSSLEEELSGSDDREEDNNEVEEENQDNNRDNRDDENDDVKEDNQFKYFSKEFYTVLYSNIDQSLTGKMDELLGYIDQHKPSIIMLTEIEPKAKKDQTKQIKDSEISIPNYQLFTNIDRKRGVAMYIESHLNPRECTNNINMNFEECAFCEFEGSNNEKFLIGCMYKSPNATKENVKKMLMTLRNEELSKYDVICIAGDFNYPKVKWEGINNGENEEFVECLKDAFLTQKVTKPTRNVRLDQQANIVDLVLVNDSDIIPEIVHSAPIGKSDHDVLIFQLNIPKNKKKETKRKRFNLAKGDYKKLRNDLRIEKWEKN